MYIQSWIEKNTDFLFGKTIAITGTTGGIGIKLCKYLASLGANLVLLDRNTKLSLSHKERLLNEFHNIDVSCIYVNLEDMNSVESATKAVINHNIDMFIHNAGAYSIPRKKCITGYDNVFQINFASPYYMIREFMPMLRKNKGKVVVVGSIAHNYSKINPDDIDFSAINASSKVYGNSKRYLMFSLYNLFKNESDVSLAITHPGITFTNITSHYPKVIFAIIKHPMKVIFMPTKIATLSILKGVFENTEYFTWIGPKLFNVWGLPSKTPLKTCSEGESQAIAEIAEKVYLQCRSISKKD